MFNFEIKSKYDYQKQRRERLNTTYNAKLLQDLKDLAYKEKCPVNKILDVLILEMFNLSEKDFNEFLNKVKNYY